MSKVQKGGFIAPPHRWFNPETTPFQPCGHPCANGRCPKNCPFQQVANAKKNGEEGEQEGGGVTMPYRWFHPNSTPFDPLSSPGCGNHCPKCGNCKKCGCMAGAQNGGDYNDFGPRGDHAQYNRSGMTEPGVQDERESQLGGAPSAEHRQTGGAPSAEHRHGQSGGANFYIDNVLRGGDTSGFKRYPKIGPSLESMAVYDPVPLSRFW